MKTGRSERNLLALAFAASILCSPVLCSAKDAVIQEASKPQSETSSQAKAQESTLISSLAIAVRSRQIVKGLPDSLVVTLTNTGQKAMELPKPDHCGNVADGMVLLRMQFKAAAGNHAPMHGKGCFNDGSQQTLAERRKGWVRLVPGEHLDTWLLVDSQGAGRYTLWVEYQPPYLSAEDRQALAAEGVLFPDRKLTSGAADFVQVP